MRLQWLSFNLRVKVIWARRWVFGAIRAAWWGPNLFSDLGWNAGTVEVAKRTRPMWHGGGKRHVHTFTQIIRRRIISVLLKANIKSYLYSPLIVSPPFVSFPPFVSRCWPLENETNGRRQGFSNYQGLKHVINLHLLFSFLSLWY